MSKTNHVLCLFSFAITCLKWQCSGCYKVLNHWVTAWRRALKGSLQPHIRLWLEQEKKHIGLSHWNLTIFIAAYSVLSWISSQGYPHKSLDSFCYYLNIHGSYIHLRNNYYGQRGASTLIVQVCVTCAIPGIRHRTLANKWIDIEVRVDIVERNHEIYLSFFFQVKEAEKDRE